jgi:integrase
MANMTAKGLEKLIRDGVSKRTPIGDGIYLTITKGGSASFGFRYKIKGKSRMTGLGAYCPINNTLSIVRSKAINIQAMVRQGIDPIDQAVKDSAAREADDQADAFNAVKDQATFKVVATEYIETKKAEWKNQKHTAQWLNTLVTYAFPKIGSMPVDSIDTQHILKVLKPIWNTKTETASRVRGRIELILDYAEVQKWRTGNNPARWKGHLKAILPSPQKIAEVKHHVAMPYEELPTFLHDLKSMDGMGARALEMAILTCLRTSECIGAKWSEIDLDKRLWTVPKERMKKGVQHRIPLSDQSMKLLTTLAEQRTNDYVFPSPSYNSGCISSGTMTAVLIRHGLKPYTVHGFRSTFRDYITEETNTAWRTGEEALAHKLTDKAEAAYQRGDLLEKRKVLMQVWANYCYQPTAKVIQMPTAKIVS